MECDRIRLLIEQLIVEHMTPGSNGILLGNGEMTICMVFGDPQQSIIGERRDDAVVFVGMLSEARV